MVPIKSLQKNSQKGLYIEKRVAWFLSRTPPPQPSPFFIPLYHVSPKIHIDLGRSRHSVIKTKQSKKCVCVCVQMWLFECVTFCYAFKKKVSFLIIQKIKLVISNMLVNTNVKSCYYDLDVGFFLVLLLSTRIILKSFILCFLLFYKSPLSFSSTHFS